MLNYVGNVFIDALFHKQIDNFIFLQMGKNMCVLYCYYTRSNLGAGRL